MLNFITKSLGSGKEKQKIQKRQQYPSMTDTACRTCDGSDGRCRCCDTRVRWRRLQWRRRFYIHVVRVNINWYTRRRRRMLWTLLCNCRQSQLGNGRLHAWQGVSPPPPHVDTRLSRLCLLGYQLRWGEGQLISIVQWPNLCIHTPVITSRRTAMAGVLTTEVYGKFLDQPLQPSGAKHISLFESCLYLCRVLHIITIAHRHLQFSMQAPTDQPWPQIKN